MPLPSDSDTNVAQLMQLLQRPEAPPDAVSLREELAYLLFYGDPTWADYYEDSTVVSDYRSILSSWFEGGAPADESEFLQLTAPVQPASDESPEELASRRNEACQALVDWFTPVVAGWKARAKESESGKAGILNPNFDGTEGTNYYWYDPENEVYLYAATADAPDEQWLSYDEHRYWPVSYDDERKTNYRIDRVTGEAEFQSRAIQEKWLTAAEWEVEQQRRAAAGGSDARVEEPLYTAPVYDEGYQMYRRFSSVSGAYEYADERAPVKWLTHAEADELFARRAAAGKSGDVGASLSVPSEEEARFVNELNAAFGNLAAALEEALQQNQ